MTYKLVVQPAARIDIQDSIAWYNRQQKGLGRRFHSTVKESFDHLRTNPFFQNRYSAVRCLPLKKFPFMVHFTVEETKKQVVVHAVFHTSLHPKVWKAER
jgi:hypothetical protein